MKFGRKNEIKINPLAYNFMLIGESGIGKTTIIKEYCEKLAGSDGYMFLETGREDGQDAINGINYITCDEWDGDYDETLNSMGFATFIDDVVENKASDWPDLKVVVIDTLDELFSIAEPEVIRMHNKENPNKRVKSIKAAFGGFMAGEDKAIEIVEDKLWSLKKVGVSFVIIGHTKTRNQTDPITGEDYMQLTTNMSQRYFNALKTKVHFLGVASIDREIVKEKTGKKNVVTGQIETKGVVKGETRRITFRDDNYVVDSKSRFADIVPEIPFDSDALIQALTDAIKSEQSKSGVSLDAAKKKQAKQEKELEKRVAEQEEQAKSQAAVDDVVSQIVDFFTENKSDIAKIKPVLTAVKNLGYDNPKSIDNVEDANKILALISE
jgi:septin family protein